MLKPRDPNLAGRIRVPGFAFSLANVESELRTWVLLLVGHPTQNPRACPLVFPLNPKPKTGGIPNKRQTQTATTSVIGNLFLMEGLGVRLFLLYHRFVGSISHSPGFLTLFGWSQPGATRKQGSLAGFADLEKVLHPLGFVICV